MWNGSGWDQPDPSNPNYTKLAPLSKGEDPADSGSVIFHMDGHTDFFCTADARTCFSILPGNTPNGLWDGDKRLLTHDEWETFGQLSPFDIDSDGVVELPFATDPDAIDPASEQDQGGKPYTKARVLKHTTTHEMGHALGIAHVYNPECLMYRWSPDWRRDDYICDESRARLKVHNKKR